MNTNHLQHGLQQNGTTRIPRFTTHVADAVIVAGITIILGINIIIVGSTSSSSININKQKQPTNFPLFQHPSETCSTRRTEFRVTGGRSRISSHKHNHVQHTHRHIQTSARTHTTKRLHTHVGHGGHTASVDFTFQTFVHS